MRHRKGLSAGARARTPSPPLSPLALRILARYRAGGLTDLPSRGSLAGELSTSRKIVEGVVLHLAERGDLVVLLGGVVIGREALSDAARTLASCGLETIDIADFKRILGIRSKVAVPILEHLERVGITRRQGDRHVILAAAARQEPPWADGG